MRTENYVYTWRNSWKSLYESPWSIFEKFKTANDILGIDMVRHLGKEEIRNNRIINSKYFSLLSLSTFDSNQLHKAFGFDLISYNQKLIDNMIGILPKRHLYGTGDAWERVYFRDNLYFCLQCLRDGYHCIFHQFKLFHHCPIHKTQLMNCCPECGVQYEYSLSNESFENLFTCSCGYQYCNRGTLFFDPWKQINQECFDSAEFKAWVTLTDEHKTRLNKMYFIPDVEFENHPDSIRYFLHSLGITVECSQIHNVVKSSKNINSIKSFDEKEFALKYSKQGSFPNVNEVYIKKIRFDVFQKEFYQNYKRIIASISKHIRKTILAQHKSCLKELIQFNGDKPVCKYAYSYIAWRRSTQNFNQFTQVDNFGRPQRLNKSIFEFPPNAPFFRELYMLWEDQLEDITLWSKAATKWIMNRVIVHVLLHRFNNWLCYSEEYISKNIMPTVPIFDNDHPFFIVLFSNQMNEEFEFHWWSIDNSVLSRSPSENERKSTNPN